MSTGYFLRKYDRTTCGGVIYPSQDKFKILGLPVARAGDSVTCGKDGKVYQIMGSVPQMSYKGIGLAGSIHSKSTCSCMAELLPSCEKAKYSTDHMVLSPSAMRASVFDLGTPQHAQAAHKPVKHQEDKLPSTCACDRDISMAEFKLIATGVTDENALRSYLDSLNLWMPWNGITTCRAKAHFLSQVCGETGAFRKMREIGGQHRHYAPWYGRGFIQLTGQGNYDAYNKQTTDDILNNLDLLLALPHATLSATWYFCKRTKCFEFTTHDDLNMVTAIINGGFNGYTARCDNFNSIVTILKAEHLNLLCRNNTFLFEDSEIYNNKVYSLAWAIWHDPDTNNQGTEKNKSESDKAYKRALTLWGSDSSREHKKGSLYNIPLNKIHAYITGKLK
ncbi:PAAR domain-containing protein [Citrobacter sp. ESBL3]|uniref:PAAR domain-containing protein n=1 Tax=Enterobacteriaceae TaxID=543 RepID=UPI002FCAB4D7